MGTMGDMTATVVVRRLGVADWRQLRDVRLRALLDSPSAFYSTYEDSVHQEPARWQSWLEPPKTVFVADLDGRSAGMIAAIPAGEMEQAPGAVMMVGMWVDPVARGNGVAEALTGALIGWARETGRSRMVLWVYDVNPRAAAFYLRYGFEPTGLTEVFGDDPRKARLMTMNL